MNIVLIDKYVLFIFCITFPQQSKYQIIMGCNNSGISQQDVKEQLVVATLNYSGILLSPYQFFEKGDDNQERLSQRMKKLSSIEGIEFKFGPFDKIWQKKRFSPLYLANCGLKNNVYMMCEQQFKQQWWKVKALNQSFLSTCFKEEMDKKKQQQNKKNEKLSENQSPDKPKKLPPINEKDPIKIPQDYEKQYNQCLKNLCAFDLLIYKAILYEVYTEGSQIKELDQNFGNKQKFQLKSKKYRKHRQDTFKKSYLDENLKIQKTIQTLDKLHIDILFLQEATEQLLSQLEKKKNNFRIVKSCRQNTKELDAKSVIIIRQDSFPHLRSLLQQNTRLSKKYTQKNRPKKKRTKQAISALKKSQFRQLQQHPQIQQIFKQIQNFNINDDTVVQVIYNLILICPHLSSKKDKNAAQVQQLHELIKYLKRTYQDCFIIVGGDMNNHTLKPFQFEVVGDDDDRFNVQINVVPDCQFHFTVHKKRTYLQAQPSKADIVNKQTKDYIITDLDILQAKVMTIDGKVISDSMKQIKSHSHSMFNQTLFGYDVHKMPQLPLLPSDSHPYDHYMVLTKLKLPEGEHLQHITYPSFLYKYHPNQLKQHDFEREQDRYQEYANRKLAQKLAKQKLTRDDDIAD